MCVASFVIRLTEQVQPGPPDKTAARYLQLHLLGFMIGRFSGSAIMKYVPAARLLALFAGGAMLCVVVALTASGVLPIWAVVLTGFFNSIMFPTIFALSLKNLGSHTKRAASLLVMAIIGVATFPALMGFISDRSSIQDSFVVPLVCYAVVLYFAIWGYKPEQPQVAAAAGSEV